jgi:protein gp37
MGDTKIEWTDATWNPVRGGSRVSEGCRNCYAERQAVRFSRHIDEIPGPAIGQKSEPFHGFVKSTPQGPRWTGRVELIPEKLDEPLRWREPRRVFVNSMSDLFHESLPDDAIAQVFAVMLLAPRHTFQILTKRPKRMQQCLSRAGFYDDVLWRAEAIRAARPKDHLSSIGISDPSLHPANWIWLGVSVEDPKTAAARIWHLLETPAARRFVSYEPALAAVDFTNLNVLGQKAGDWPEVRLDALRGHVKGPDDMLGVRIDQVIVGGESGPGARPCDVAWIRSVVRQCREAGVACFVKQVGAGLSLHTDAGRGRHHRDSQANEVFITKHPKGGDPAEWPEDLRVQEYPR